MMKVSKLAVSGLLLLTMAMGAGCGSKAPAEQTPAQEPAAEKETYILGTNAMFDPFEYVDDNGQVVGFDIDLVKAIAEDQGFNIEVQDMAFDALIGSVQTGAIDIIAAGMTIDEDRQKQVAFSNEYIEAGLVLAVSKDNDTIKSVDDLKDKVVGAQIGTTGADQCYALKEQGLVKEVRILENVNLCMMDLQNGGLDAVINDAPVTNAYMAKQPDKIKLIGEPLTVENYAIAVNLEDKALLEKINTGLENIKANGTYDEIMNKYFGSETK